MLKKFVAVTATLLISMALILATPYALFVIAWMAGVAFYTYWHPAEVIMWVFLYGIYVLPSLIVILTLYCICKILERK